MPQQFSSQLAPLNNEENKNNDKKNKIYEKKWSLFKYQRPREWIYLDVINSWLLILFIGCKEIENHYGFRYSNNDFITFNTILTCLLIYIFSLWFSIKFEINRRKLLRKISLILKIKQKKSKLTLFKTTQTKKTKRKKLKLIIIQEIEIP